MIYQIVDKYYVKVGKDFVEVELEYKNNDINLKPTTNKLENNGNLKYKEINFLSEKQNILNDYKLKNKQSEVEKIEEVEQFKSFRKKSFK